ncbi:hypothetical protein ACFOND_11525 [Reinekea marina]|uniref:Uncharacterized protein n=2 Tax=Reinekea marina TaxID=1310421 RepID=A0ABV7WUU8_9GAMM
MESLDTIFPEMKETEWKAYREAGWELALTKGKLKAEYRKKELTSIRKYFFEGILEAEMPLTTYSITMLKMFPIQNKKGYDYYYSNLNWDEKLLLDATYGSYLDQSSSGMTDQDQLAYWDYHLGTEFQPIVTRTTQKGDIALELDPNHLSFNILVNLDSYMSRDLYSFEPKWVLKLDYLFSIFKYMTANNCNVSNDLFDFYSDLISDVYNRKFGKRLTEVTEYHIQFCNEFVTKVETFEHMPGPLREALDTVRKESKP